MCMNYLTRIQNIIQKKHTRQISRNKSSYIIEEQEGNSSPHQQGEALKISTSCEAFGGARALIQIVKNS